jgi:hypothetical protein
MVNGAVMFADGQRVRIGESGRNVRVVSASPPWSARLEWDGVEFDVELFQRDATVVRAVDRSFDDATPLSPTSSGTDTPRREPAPATEPAGARPPAAEPANEPEPEPEPDPQGEPEPTEPESPPDSPSPPDPQPQPSDPESL